MRTRRGMVLMQVLVMTTILLAITSLILRQCLQGRTLRRKVVLKEEAVSSLEGERAMAWGCLNDTGYPLAGTCRGNSAHAACAPPGTSIIFTGTYPNCRIMLAESR